MAQHNPFLDPKRDVVQGRSDEDILARYRMRQHAAAGAVAEGNPGYKPLEGYVRQEKAPAKETTIFDINTTVREHLRESGVPKRKLDRMGLGDMVQYIFDDMEAFCREVK